MPRITTGELAAALGLPLRGDANVVIAAAAGLEEAGPEDLAFAGSPVVMRGIVSEVNT